MNIFCRYILLSQIEEKGKNLKYIIWEGGGNALKAKIGQLKQKFLSIKRNYNNIYKTHLNSFSLKKSKYRTQYLKN